MQPSYGGSARVLGYCMLVSHGCKAGMSCTGVHPPRSSCPDGSCKLCIQLREQHESCFVPGTRARFSDCKQGCWPLQPAGTAVAHCRTGHHEGGSWLDGQLREAAAATALHRLAGLLLPSAGQSLTQAQRPPPPNPSVDLRTCNRHEGAQRRTCGKQARLRHRFLAQCLNCRVSHFHWRRLRGVVHRQHIQQTPGGAGFQLSGLPAAGCFARWACRRPVGRPRARRRPPLGALRLSPPGCRPAAPAPAVQT